MTQQMTHCLTWLVPLLLPPTRLLLLMSSHNPTSCPRLKTQHSEETLSLTDPPTHRHTDPSARHHKPSQEPITDSSALSGVSLSCTHPTTDPGRHLLTMSHIKLESKGDALLVNEAPPAYHEAVGDHSLRYVEASAGTNNTLLLRSDGVSIERHSFSARGNSLLWCCGGCVSVVTAAS
jgi:hypothetical protein